MIILNDHFICVFNAESSDPMPVFQNLVETIDELSQTELAEFDVHVKTSQLRSW